MTERTRTFIGRGLPALLVIFGAGVLAIPSRPPAPGPVQADAFDRTRAAAHIQALATAPRPAGSAGSAQARDYLCGALTAAGLECAVQEFSAPAVENGASVERTASNVLTRIPGSQSGGIVLLTAHRDTVPASPGAIDNAAGCAVLLEAARLLTGETRRRNDVVLLWTDAKESGRGGIQAFLNSHPWAKDVQVVINVDPRGTSGPALMFETNEPNGWAIQRFAAASPAPAASSFMVAVEAMMPNGLDDFGWIRRAGVPGLNFMMIDGGQRYHRATDTAATIDAASLDHLGREVIAATRAFAAGTLPPPASANLIYFDVAQRWLVTYPERLALPLALVGGALLVCALVAARRTSALRVGGVLTSAGLFLAASFAMWAVFLIGGPMIAGLTGTGQGYTGSYILGASLLVTAVATLFARRRIRRDGWNTTAAGMAVCWLPLSIASAALAPGTSYVFAWPLLLAAAGYLLKTRISGAAAAIAAVVLAVPVVLICMPANYVLLAGLGPRAIGLLLFLMMLQAGVLAVAPLLLFGPAAPRTVAAPATLVSATASAPQS